MATTVVQQKSSRVLVLLAGGPQGNSVSVSPATASTFLSPGYGAGGSNEGSLSSRRRRGPRNNTNSVRADVLL